MDISMPSFEKLQASIPPSIKKHFPSRPPTGGKMPPASAMKKIVIPFLLWAISKKPITGYSLIKKLGEDCHPISTPARIYPLLVHMEKEGLVHSKTLKKGKRESKEYSITPKGKLVIQTTRKILSQMLWGEFLREISRRD
jgi:DNA-binding PadR family transcriptional regulator